MLSIHRRLRLPIPQLRDIGHAEDVPPWPGRGADLGDLHARGGAGDHGERHRLARLLPAHAARERGLLHARQLRQRWRGEIGLIPPARLGSRGGRDRGQRRGLGDDGPRGQGRVAKRDRTHQRHGDDEKGEG